jgi:hypothetical protein
MSISVGGTTGFLNSFQPRSPATTTSQANSAFAPTSAPTDSANSAPASSSSPSASFVPPTSFGDGIQVNLPNGISVGVFQISQGGAQAPASGDGGAYAQMLQSVEQLVAAFANTPGAAANDTASASPQSLPSAANLAPGQSVDGIDVALPNGYSAEIFGIEQGSAGTASGSGGTIDDQMVDTMEQLVANLSQYPATAASAYNKTVSAAPPAAAGVNSVA